MTKTKLRDWSKEIPVDKEFVVKVTQCDSIQKDRYEPGDLGDFFELLLDTCIFYIIGPDLIALMTDEELSKYIPLHGERLRVRKYLRDRVSSKNRGKRSSLLQVLREKIETRERREEKGGESNKEKEMRESNRRFGNKNAEKEKRRIELGWIHKSNGKSVQIRSKKGGGTRRLTLQKDATKEDLLEIGKKLFFPHGESSKGNQNKFHFDVWDYQDRSMDERSTVGQMYKDTKMPILRFYLASVEPEEDIVKKQLDDDMDTDSLPDLYSPSKQSASSTSPDEKSSNDILSEAIQIAGIENEQEFGIYDIPDLFGIIEEDPNLSNASESNYANIANNDTVQTTEHLLKLHRGQVMREMIEAFGTEGYTINSVIKPQMIMPNGEMEVAEDAGGVTRDALSEFWSSFYTECTLGNEKKVPCLRHDFGEEQWKSVAKIIVFGWKTVSYFPVQISPVFMQYCLFGTFQDDLLDAFMQYIPKNDAETLQAALKDVNSVDQSELDDIFTQHELKRVPRQANMERILREMAHKELLQAAMFVIDCWSPVLKEIHLPQDKLQSLYRDLIPTPRRVTSLLKFPENMCEDSTATSHHLKRFIREMDSELLTRFLRFCTGADLLTEKCIEVSFVKVEGLARRPVAHTCSSLLELPKQYENFLKFRTEFISVLNANIWVMDII